MFRRNTLQSSSELKNKETKQNFMLTPCLAPCHDVGRKTAPSKRPLNFTNYIALGVASSGMLGRAALVRTDVSEERSISIIRVTKIGELGTTLAVTSNRQRASVASNS
jgi:hypothetical protein